MLYMAPICLKHADRHVIVKVHALVYDNLTFDGRTWRITKAFGCVVNLEPRASTYRICDLACINRDQEQEAII
jgi:hypothetical protein